MNDSDDSVVREWAVDVMLHERWLRQATYDTRAEALIAARAIAEPMAFARRLWASRGPETFKVEILEAEGNTGFIKVRPDGARQLVSRVRRTKG